MFTWLKDLFRVPCHDCPQCDQRGFTRNALTDHMRWVHDPIDNRIHDCDPCPVCGIIHPLGKHRPGENPDNAPAPMIAAYRDLRAAFAPFAAGATEDEIFVKVCDLVTYCKEHKKPAGYLAAEVARLIRRHAPAVAARKQQRKVTHEMAREAFRKMHNALCGGGPVPMMSIPARLDDADIVLSDYICQQKAASTPPNPPSFDGFGRDESGGAGANGEF